MLRWTRNLLLHPPLPYSVLPTCPSQAPAGTVDDPDQNKTLDHLTYKNAAVQQLRNQYGADLVQLYFTGNSSQVGLG